MNLAELVPPDRPAFALPIVAERDSAILEYRLTLVAMLREIRAELVASVLPAYREYRRQASDGMVRDDGEEYWFAAIAAAAAMAVRRAAARAERLLRRESASFTTRFVASVKRGAKVEIPPRLAAPRQDIDELLRLAVQRNTALIQGLSDDALQRIQRAVLDSRLNRASAASLSKMLTKEFGVLKSRADLIAVNEVGNHHSLVTRLHHEAVGIRWWMWVSQSDGRVRTLHQRISGRVYEHGKPTDAEGGLPAGQPYRCRCRQAAMVSPGGRKPAPVATPGRREFPKNANTV